MKNTSIMLTIILVLLAATMVTSCDQSAATSPPGPPGPPPGPDPMEVLEEQVCAERLLRKEAETKAVQTTNPLDGGLIRIDFEVTVSGTNTMQAVVNAPDGGAASGGGGDEEGRLV
jgi:hypothetical protein